MPIEQPRRQPHRHRQARQDRRSRACARSCAQGWPRRPRRSTALLEIIGITGDPSDVIETPAPAACAGTDDGEASLREIADVFGYATAMGVAPERYSFDLSLVRGLGYYTGTIYETVLPGSALGSLGGGGRYDELIGMFLGRDFPAVGISFGIERIFDALDERACWRRRRHHDAGAGDALRRRDGRAHRSRWRRRCARRASARRSTPSQRGWGRSSPSPTRRASRWRSSSDQTRRRAAR